MRVNVADSSRKQIANLFHNQSSEMSPQEIGAFIAVITRPFGSKPSDDDATVRDGDGRVKEYHTVLFDYIAGASDHAINTQAAPTTEACIGIILAFEEAAGLQADRCDSLLAITSDNCTADLKCADHFAALSTWANLDPETTTPALLRVKQSLGFKTIRRVYGTEYHGKYEGDHVATESGVEADKMSLIAAAAPNVCLY